jgi:hypothetical protein
MVNVGIAVNSFHSQRDTLLTSNHHHLTAMPIIEAMLSLAGEDMSAQIRDVLPKY